MSSSLSPCTPKSSKDKTPIPLKANLFFREENFQACSTPCIHLGYQNVFLEENLSSIIEQDESTEGFSKSDNITIIEVPDEGDNPLLEDADHTLIPSSNNVKQSKLSLNKIEPRDKILCELNNNELGKKKCVNLEILNSENNFKDKNIIIKDIPIKDISNDKKEQLKNINHDLNEALDVHKNITSLSGTDLPDGKIESSVNLHSDNLKNTNFSGKGKLLQDVPSTKTISAQNLKSDFIKMETNPTYDVKVDCNRPLGYREISGEIISRIPINDGIITNNNVLPEIQEKNYKGNEEIPKSSNNISEPLKKYKFTESKNDCNKIATEELNVTVTEEDLYFSKRDEISICFDAIENYTILNVEKNFTDNIIGAQSSKRGTDEVLKSFTNRISEIRDKVTSEIAIPPAPKKPCIAVKGSDKVRPLEVFISNNLNENCDNNDTEWNKYAQLTSDELRYECVRKIWRNEEIPNANKNMSTYNWRMKNRLPQRRYFKNNETPYSITKGGDVRSIMNKVRDDAKLLFGQKVRTLQMKRDNCYRDADANLDNQLARIEPSWRPHFYKEYRNEIDAISVEYDCCLEALIAGFEERISAVDQAEKEVSTFTNFYKGLHGDSKYNLSQRALSCWFEREDILNKYELYYV